MNAGAGDDGDGAGTDAGFMQLPIGDLFLALGAAFLVAMLLGEGLRAERQAEGGGRPAEAEQTETLRVVADSAGITLPADRAEPGLARAVDVIPGDPAVTARLRAAAAAGRPVLLVIDEGGGESAFLFESLASAAGVARLQRLRLDRNCRFAKERLDGEACHALLLGLRAGV